MTKIGDVIPIKPELVPVLQVLFKEREDAYDALSAAQEELGRVGRKFFKVVYDEMPEMKGCAFIYDRERSNLIVASTGNEELTKAIEG